MVSPNSGRTHYKVCKKNSLLGDSKLINTNYFSKAEMMHKSPRDQGVPFLLTALSCYAGKTVQNLHSAEQEQSEQL